VDPTSAEERFDNSKLYNPRRGSKPPAATGEAADPDSPERPSTVMRLMGMDN